MKSRSFYLTVDSREEQESRLLCEEVCRDTEDVQVFTNVFWEMLKTLAKERSSLHIEEDETDFVFKNVYSKIHDKEAFGKVHSFFLRTRKIGLRLSVHIFYDLYKKIWRRT